MTLHRSSALLALACCVVATPACDALLGADFDHGSASNGDLPDGAAGANADGAANGNGGEGGNGTKEGGPGSLDASGSGADGAADARAGDGSGGTAETPADVLTSATLALWLDADKGVLTIGGSKQVTSWADQSGNHHDGAPFGAGGGDLQVNATQLNGHAAVQINGDAVSIGDVAPVVLATQDFYVGVVAEYTVLGMNDRFFVSRFDGFPRGFGLFAGTQNGSTVAGSFDPSGGVIEPSSVTGTADGKYRVYAIRRTAGSMGKAKLDIRVNGVSTSVLVPYPTLGGQAGRPLMFGGSQQLSSTGSGFMIGAFAEIAMAVGTVSDADIQRIEAGWKTKYALP